jgi:hypothetical protein
MGLPRSTYYDVPSLPTDDAALVATMRAICDEFEAYGYRRVGAELRHRGIVVNSKKIRRHSEVAVGRSGVTATIPHTKPSGPLNRHARALREDAAANGVNLVETGKTPLGK